jgi:hypothetical protein
MAKILYKLTDKNGFTKGNTKWGENVNHKVKHKGYHLCSKELIHAYEHPFLAAALHICHVSYDGLQLWKAKTNCRKIITDGSKVGVKSLTTIHKIPLPTVTFNNKVIFAILLLRKIYGECERHRTFYEWSEEWLKTYKCPKVNPYYNETGLFYDVMQSLNYKKSNYIEDTLTLLLQNFHYKNHKLDIDELVKIAMRY